MATTAIGTAAGTDPDVILQISSSSAVSSSSPLNNPRSNPNNIPDRKASVCSYHSSRREDSSSNGIPLRRLQGGGQGGSQFQEEESSSGIGTPLHRMLGGHGPSSNSDSNRSSGPPLDTVAVHVGEEQAAAAVRTRRPGLKKYEEFGGDYRSGNGDLPKSHPDSVAE
ncbi:hypothetical protein MMC14_002000 [Varicellaria rhodocarpa]|nr:hypothetical protein [Varicellaria rhodocarpa]